MRVASAELAHPSSTNTASRSNFILRLHFLPPSISIIRVSPERERSSASSRCASSAPLRTRSETVSSSEPRSLGKSIEMPRGSFSAETSVRKLLLHFFQERVPKRSQCLEQGARARRRRAGAVRNAPNFGPLENSGDRDVLAHGDFVERVEQRSPTDRCEDAVRARCRASRRATADPSRAIDRDGSAAAVARQRARESARRSRQHSCGIS